MIIDGDVEELPAGAAGVIALAVAGDAMAGAFDAGELLDVEMDELAGLSAFVAAAGGGGWRAASLRAWRRRKRETDARESLVARAI